MNRTMEKQFRKKSPNVRRNDDYLRHAISFDLFSECDIAFLRTFYMKVFCSNYLNMTLVKNGPL